MKTTPTILGLPTAVISRSAVCGHRLSLRAFALLRQAFCSVIAVVLVMGMVSGGSHALGQSKITSPPTSQLLTVPKFGFNWNAVSGAQEYFLYLGSSAGGNQYYGASQGMNTSANLTWGSPPAEVYVRLWSKCPVYSGVAGSTPAYYSWMYNDYRFQFAAASVKVVLFLHGMNSSAATWATARSDMGFGALPTISNGSISGTAAGDYRGVLAYAVQFGATDSTSGRKGLESISGGANYSTSGDFETFAALGTEVSDAVTAIVNKNKATYGNVEVVLVGHSRGGLAGRAFLQTATSSAAKGAVKGFITTGSPHTGSRLARFNTWLGSNPRDPKKQSADWDVADFMKKYGALDVRRPTIGDLSDQSSAISSLASGLNSLPTGIKCVGIQYNAYALGRANAGYNLFDAALYQYGPQVTTACRNFLIGSTGKPSGYMGDGIVPAANQQFPGKTNVSYSASVLHTEEPQRSSDLKAGLKKVVTWWD